ncbi:YajG family lipoprotein [Motiliproteus sp. MSK22-1]|uniref:YajG family lipoprotein n=1 Tax=Motiliproteus sp. MSK22-1 TaxID=1897630 RepID=UPI000976E2EA|nr:YajG family lipoprotein [Motiliproteus sp. MSK22-1]OMH25926.1 hypothetical protein BGP75_25810 [Motiliproteus sp. MSK22-1]
MLLKTSLLALLSIALTGCALSPQNVELNPTVTVTNSIPVSHVVKLNIEDRRSQNQLGTRGGVYAESSYIYPARPIEESLRPTALKALENLGLQTTGMSPSPILVNIIIDELSYTADDSSVPKKVTLKTRIRANVLKASREHNGQFNSSKTHSYIKLPSEEENQKIINDILSETLTRLFNDQKLVDFIKH